ncbi:C40 family peptidase, partial [Vibrio cholerae]|nr:C40 family peptidase [Vibrio cholerae]
GGPVAGGDELFKKVMDEAIKYQGWPYVWGGRTPQSSFDCSGLIQWVYGQAGINLVGTAETQFKMTQRTNDPQPGDLIFFQGTY